MINEERNKEIFILKYPKSLTTKSIVESESFGGSHWKVWLLGTFENQQFMEMFNINRAAQYEEHANMHFRSFDHVVLHVVEKDRALV